MRPITIFLAGALYALAAAGSWHGYTVRAGTCAQQPSGMRYVLPLLWPMDAMLTGLDRVVFNYDPYECRP